MIGADYVLMMARYNAWQNDQIIDTVNVVDEEALRKDHGAFFGSILNTLNHILWADTLWLNRFSDAFDPPSVPPAEHTSFTETPAAWQAARREKDSLISGWAAGLSDDDLQGDLVWTPTMTGIEMRKPRALCVAQVFNHQTHHRGQVHAMLTASGQSAPTTDIVFMPEIA